MLFIFDWDGTLSDSTGKIIGCMQHAASDLALPSLRDEAVQDIIGLGLPEAICKLYPGISDGDRDALRKQYSVRFIEADQQPSPFFPGVMDTLNQMREQGHHIAVATGKSRKGLDRVFSNLELHDFFHSSRCADETASKPHPLMLHELLKEFKLSAGESVMIGDTEYDMEMAMRAEVPRVAVSYGAHSLDRLQAYEPTHCIDRIDQLLALI